MNKLQLTLTWIALVFTVSTANAGFMGNTIEANACFPNLACDSVTAGPVSAVVDGSVEFSDGEFLPFFGPTFDFDDTTVTITHAQTGHQSGDFNGYIFSDLNGTIDDIIGVSILSDSTGFFSGDPSRIFFDINNLFINFESLMFQGTENPTIVLSVAFASSSVPAPMSLWLLGSALLGLVAMRRKELA